MKKRLTIDLRSSRTLTATALVLLAGCGGVDGDGARADATQAQLVRDRDVASTAQPDLGKSDPAGPRDGAPGNAQAGRPLVHIDARRSLAITERSVLARFSLQRTMQQIVSSSGVPRLTPTELFRQWWDTQNLAPGVSAGPHCDDALADAGPTLNGFPLTCRPDPIGEGVQASCDPFAAGSACAYIPVGLFMRFDLAKQDGRTCGEYRIVYAKQSGQSVATDRNLLIFEAAMSNPHATIGVAGCRNFVRAWADLSAIDDPARRADRLEDMYFNGYHEFPPIVSATSFGDNDGGFGQVRTNQFIQPVAPRVWSLREFKVLQRCASGNGCALQFVPVSDKVNPYGRLFAPASQHPLAPSFQVELAAQVATLAATDLAAITMHTAEVFDSAQSQENGTDESNYAANFGAAESALRSAIQASLTRMGSALTPDDIVARAQAMACAGCHRLSNGAALGGGLTWPSSLGFTHVSERDVDLETENGEVRYRISPALTDALLPARKLLVEDFLNDVPRPLRARGEPLGGRWVH